MQARANIRLDFEFVPAGTTAEPAPGRLFVDVGNGFGPGLLDHHAPGTPGTCSAQLALQHPRHVSSQVGASRQMTIVTHKYPDMDAISGVYFARAGPWTPRRRSGPPTCAGWIAATRGWTRRGRSTPTRS